MKRWSCVAATVVVLGVAAMASAEPATQPAAAAADVKPPISWEQAIVYIAACLGGSIAAFGGAYGISRIGGQCLDAMARQPEATGAMFGPMVVAAAMVEGLGLFAIVVCLMAILK